MEQIIEDAMTKEDVRERVQISLQDYIISDAGVQYLCERDTYKVKKLFLDNNSITENGALHFSLAKWSSLTQLSLDNNNIGNRGCLYLSRTSMKNLQKLGLAENRLESSGVSHLTKGKWTLYSICLEHNKICYNAITSISKASWNLTKIVLICNQLKADELLKIIFLETPIKKVDLYYLWWINPEYSVKETTIKAIKGKFGEIKI